ncbi:hypothetical protein FG381_01125 [Sutterella faecalis]|uniref:AAA family ATPase n=2 Tax=Sutterella TaxID=40544 RepID=A0AAI9SC14_9BURK|nr:MULTISPECIES: AAA family ATPase [Sutterella]KAB7651245.1 AAA family ATPase [Sutterella seckii]QDA53650.1 hypothetical protein FG381_01125 [Sutterella faecalis]
MQVTSPRPPSAGNQDFAALRRGNRVYADKTRLIFDLCAGSGSMVLLMRPPRFGKSLLVSAIESLFRFGLREFQGLAMESLWRNRIHEVVRLDFSLLQGLRSEEAFETALQRLILTRFAVAGFRFSSEDGGISFFDQFGEWLSDLEPGSLVLLVDDFDQPLASLLDDPALFEAAGNLLSRFYAVVKANEGRLRFFLMTGTANFRGSSLFSELNSVTDITLDAWFGTLLGFTEEELETWFASDLKRAESALGLSRRELLLMLETHYGGFSFDRRAKTRVFSPASILEFLARPEAGFRNYWLASSGMPLVLQNHSAVKGPLLPEDLIGEIAVEVGTLASPLRCGDAYPYALLTQAGCLTIRRELVTGIVELGVTNREASDVVERLSAGGC